MFFTEIGKYIHIDMAHIGSYKSLLQIAVTVEHQQSEGP